MKCKLSKLFFLVLVGAVSVNGYSQTEAERKEIVKEYDLKKINELIKKFDSKFQANYDLGLQIAKERGLPIEGM